jgi:pimeloyl-ACP methyl ester carboxylesterase
MFLIPLAASFIAGLAAPALALVALAMTLAPAPAVATPAVTTGPAEGPAPLVLTDCRLHGPAAGSGIAARCGHLSVPEDYAAPAGRRIALHVAVVPTLGTRRGEPLFVLAGGPGQAAGSFYAAVAPAFALVARTHDIVLVDQRGTGRSHRLSCHFPDDLTLSRTGLDELEDLSRRCLQSLDASPAHYTTSVAVRDLDAVRQALGYGRISLYGASYGTRVAQHYLRRHADAVAAVILDGVVAPPTTVGPAMALDAERALQLAFTRCAGSAACHGAFPDPAADLAASRERLAHGPLALDLPDPATGASRRIEFGPRELAGSLRLLTYTARTSALIPLLLHAAAGGDFRPIGAQFLMFDEAIDDEIAYGMHNAVLCTEDAPDFGRADRAALAKTFLGAVELDSLAAMCRPWPVGERDPDLKSPLAANVPALLLSGEADPVTPPAEGELAARGFRDARHLVLAGQGHGQLGTGCVPDLMARFLTAHSATQLDTSCVGRVRGTPFFIDFAGPAP